MSLTLHWSRFCARAEVENPQDLLVGEALETTKSGRGFGAADRPLRSRRFSRDCQGCGQLIFIKGQIYGCIFELKTEARAPHDTQLVLTPNI
jgi:hypothetical protein